MLGCATLVSRPVIPICMRFVKRVEHEKMWWSVSCARAFDDTSII